MTDQSTHPGAARFERAQRTRAQSATGDGARVQALVQSHAATASARPPRKAAALRAHAFGEIIASK